MPGGGYYSSTQKRVAVICAVRSNFHPGEGLVSYQAIFELTLRSRVELPSRSGRNGTDGGITSICTAGGHVSSVRIDVLGVGSIEACTSTHSVCCRYSAIVATRQVAAVQALEYRWSVAGPRELDPLYPSA
jgi:hypothetical protein